MFDAINGHHQPVEITDEVTAGLEAAAKLATAFYANGRGTLVASFAASDVVKWDGSEEKALVSDPDEVELPDEIGQGQAA